MTDEAYDPYAVRNPRGIRPADSNEITETSQTVAAGQLRSIIERVERLHEERKTLGDDLKEVYAEAKGSGFDTKAIKVVVKKRAMDTAERHEHEAIVDLYMAALGMS